MNHRQTYRQHARATLFLGLPLIASHIAQFAINLSDAVMLGWYSIEALAAEVLGGTLFFVLFIMGSGFAWALMPMVAGANASNQQAQVRRVTRMATWLSMGYGILVIPLMFFADTLFKLAGQNPMIADMAAEYLRIICWGILPAMMIMVLKCYLAALERTQVVLWVTVVSVLVNIAINYLLIFGNWGFPELGLRGAAIASFSVNLFGAIGLAIYAARALPEHALFQRLWRPDWEALIEVFRLGWPIGITNLAEVGLFAATSVMMGWIGTIPLAAHGIALQITSVIFMVHLGLSNAATVRAGQAYARRDIRALRDGAVVLACLSGATVIMTSILLLAAPDFLIGMFMSPAEANRDQVSAIGRGLLAAAALYQLVDAAQVQAIGLLRGMRDTRVPMIIAALSYWALGIPASYVFGFVFGWQGVGIWLGLAVGLACAAVFMVIRFIRFTARETAAV